jgi:hypothetical protein
MTATLTERYEDRIAGVLSCHDRIVITGTSRAEGYLQHFLDLTPSRA